MKLHQPQSLTEALELYGRLGDDTKVMAGGQSLLAMMRQGLIDPELVVSLKHIPQLREITILSDGTLFIGSMVTHQQIIEHPMVRRHVPLLSHTAQHVASRQVRNMGTWGGNVSHGEPGSDPPASLIVSEASIELSSLKTKRTIPIEQFFLDYLTTDIQPGEIVTGLIIPRQPSDARTWYFKHTVRDDGDLAVCGIAIRLTMNEGAIQDLRIGVNGASLTPINVRDVNTEVVGQHPSPGLFRRVGELCAASCDPIDDAEATADYRLAVVESAVVSTLSHLAIAL